MSDDLDNFSKALKASCSCLKAMNVDADKNKDWMKKSNEQSLIEGCNEFG